MANIINEYFKDYSTSRPNFEKFHNQVINMPRDSFSTAKLSKLQTLAAYLLLIEGKARDSGENYKTIMFLIIDEFKKSHYPEKYRDTALEGRYFPINSNFEVHYKNQGRMFRHLMGLCAFFGFIQSSTRRSKIVNFDTCKEIVLSKDNVLKPLLRNIMLDININSNDYINSLEGIRINSTANYRPAYSILRFIKEINRPATMFEISILLGRIDDEIQTEEDILRRAIKVAKILPRNRDDQIKMFFGSLNWKFRYSSSQEPYFKFKTFLLFMQNFGLIQLNESNSLVTNTQDAVDLISAEVPIELADLEKLLSQIGDDEDENALAEIILRKRTPLITQAIKNDSNLVEKMNQRGLRKIEFDSKGKKKRNRIIAELAKILANYTCEVTGQKTFKMPNGLYYVEAHHIIEFSTEDGPDITDNILVLGPEKHSLIHYACKEEIEAIYNLLKTNNKINYERFRKMHVIYGCLTVRHVQILFDKKLITSTDKANLLKLISEAKNPMKGES